MARVDVLADMKAAAEDVVSGDVGLRLLWAAESVAELIAADSEYDAAKARRIEADNRITSGDRSDDAFRRQENTHHAYDRAVARRAAALARVRPIPKTPDDTQFCIEHGIRHSVEFRDPTCMFDDARIGGDA